ncbi:MAG: hypothetical protein JSW34_01990 [Candidatus Zixiibacteriota bacterium]|nr:MAG: hypothetical protein JSW34_01990 [candidate division Zixibacteria bacterium]
MSKLLIVILVISIIGNALGLTVLYKYFGAKRAIERERNRLERANDVVEDLTETLDRMYSNRMIFLHHSVGRGILYEGGLRDSLLEMGVLVKGATYGDEIGEKTDIGDWAGKFASDMDRILDFKAHPNRYYSGSLSNDVIMFKSCFPNSNIQADGTLPGDPSGTERTTANYKAAFERLAETMKDYPDKLYIYVTSPPLVPESTTPENARRAKEFNAWLQGEYLAAYTKDTGFSNLAIFDLFGVLADESGMLKAEYRRPTPGDSHPNKLGNEVAASRFMEFFRPLWPHWTGKKAGTQPQRAQR